ncbi:MAG: biosynthetic-type acetolactate synthase large subunit, partial [Candidatus Diapherotrites archaeon]|nr:biosynthetic-type acetolactate synthase large subunit [Candidatus Diapherotrites archaeon]
AGQVPTSLIGNDAFQESDMMGITLPITKHNYQIRDPNKIRATIKNAFKVAIEGRPGPVYIDLPKDVQAAEITREVKEIPMQGFKPVFSGHPRQIKLAAEMILKAEMPVLVAGGGAIISNASPEIQKLAQMLNIPVATTFMGKSSFPETHPLSLGMIGMHGRKSANYAISNADLLIVVGCRFSDRVTGNVETFAEKAKIIHIDIDSAEIGKNVAVELPIVGDAKNVLSQLIAAIGKAPKKGTAWAEKMGKFVKECSCSIDVKTTPIDPRKLIFELQNVLKDQDIVVTGTGQQQMFAAHFIKRANPRTFISSGGAGTMGFGLPASLGAKVARPEVEVFNFDGDGSFAMTQQELATLKVENIKTTSIIMNNAYLGMVRQWAELFFDRRYSSVYLSRVPDFAKIAEAHGLKGMRVEKPGEIAPALREAVKSDEAVVLDVIVKEEANILPMFSAGGNVTDMFGGCIKIKGEFF